MQEHRDCCHELRDDDEFIQCKTVATQGDPSVENNQGLALSCFLVVGGIN